jgi:hypothetical protein
MSEQIEMSRHKYLALMKRRRDAVDTLTRGLRDYLAADFEAEIEAFENSPQQDQSLTINRLTEDLMSANAEVELVEQQSAQVREYLNNLDPSTLAMLKPFEPLINGFLAPFLQRMYFKAVRKRDDIQAELEELNAEEGAGA